MITAKKDSEQTRSPGRTCKRILFANAKGGCGKSTLATNLASTYAAADVPTALIDHDPQASAAQWLKRRPQEFNAIHGIDASRRDSSGATGNWFMRIPREIRRVIVDTPAGLQGPEFQDQIRQADVIIVPVLPSPIDIHSATRFIGNILLSHEYRRAGTPKQLVVLANRTRKNTRVLHKLDLFLNSLKLPRLGNIRDAQQYVHCSETGIGLIDTTDSRHRQDREQWLELKGWLENYFARSEGSGQPGSRDEPTIESCREIGEEVYTFR